MFQLVIVKRTAKSGIVFNLFFICPLRFMHCMCISIHLQYQDIEANLILFELPFSISDILLAVHNSVRQHFIKCITFDEIEIINFGANHFLQSRFIFNKLMLSNTSKTALQILSKALLQALLSTFSTKRIIKMKLQFQDIDIFYYFNHSYLLQNMKNISQTY